MAHITARTTARRAAQRATREDARSRKVFDGVKREAEKDGRIFTSDSFQNLALKLGVGADNALTSSSYGYYPISRIRILLEWIHRGSWLGGIAVDVVADDMTREGIEITSSMPPDQVQKLDQAMLRQGVWSGLNNNIKWGRLYGGSVAYIMIDGQDPMTPLRVDTIAKGQFKGLLILDRWMLNPSLERMVFDPIWGMVPEFYDTMTQYMGIPRVKFHYTRCVRMEGIGLPWQQRLTENMWGLSVLERMYDRMVAFDSGTMGVAQSLYKSFLRYMKVEDFKAVASVGGAALTGMAKYIDMIRKYQSVEGMTIIDAKDDFGTHQNQTFSGMSEGLLQLGQQLAGALQIPMVRLFGQSPAGLNSTGESDLRTYYDGIKSQQERTLRIPLDTIMRIVAKSEGIKVPDDFEFNFKPLWQQTPKEKADTAETIGRTVTEAYAGGLISQRVAVAELQQSSHVTGVFTNITPEDIEASEDLVPTSQGGVDPATGELVQPIEEEGDEDGEDGDESNDDKGKSGKEAGVKVHVNVNNNGNGAKKKSAAGKKGGKGNGKANGRKSRDKLPFTVLGHRDYQGIPCVVEQPPGFDRRGHASDGACAYGYISKTVGMDKENIDCLFGPDENCFMVWAINQGVPDPEHKIALGFKRWGDALVAYQCLYPDYPPPESVVGMPLQEFKTWLSNPDNHLKPAFRSSRAVAE